MPANITIEGVACTIEKLPNVNIRVSFVSPQFNAMHGQDTGGNFMYEVHPCQRYQYSALNAQLPPSEQLAPEGSQSQRPWWSLSAGERAGLRD